MGSEIKYKIGYEISLLAYSLSEVNLVLEATHVLRHLKDIISMAMSIISNDIAASTALLMGELSCALSMLSTDGDGSICFSTRETRTAVETCTL